MKKRPFSLLEVMVVICILVIAGGAMGLRFYSLAQEKRRTSQIERLKHHIVILQKLALTTKLDWSARLIKEKKGWKFIVYPDEGQPSLFKPIDLDDFIVTLDGKRVEKEFLCFFYATGHVSSLGELTFQKDQVSYTVSIQNLLKRREVPEEQD